MSTVPPTSAIRSRIEKSPPAGGFRVLDVEAGAVVDDLQCRGRAIAGDPDANVRRPGVSDWVAQRFLRNTVECSG